MGRVSFWNAVGRLLALRPMQPSGATHTWVSSRSGPENTAKPFSLLNRCGPIGSSRSKIGSRYASIRAARRVPGRPRPHASTTIPMLCLPDMWWPRLPLSDGARTGARAVSAVILLGFWPCSLLDQWPHDRADSLDRMALLGSEED